MFTETKIYSDKKNSLFSEFFYRNSCNKFHIEIIIRITPTPLNLVFLFLERDDMIIRYNPATIVHIEIISVTAFNISITTKLLF